MIRGRRVLKRASKLAASPMGLVLAHNSAAIPHPARDVPHAAAVNPISGESPTATTAFINSETDFGLADYAAIEAFKRYYF